MEMKKGMDKIKILQKYQEKIIEGIVVCLVGGWTLSSMIRGAFKETANLEYCAKSGFVSVIVLMLICSAALGIIYYMCDSIARILMFVFVCSFTILCAYNGYNIQWGQTSYNPIGKICFAGILCFAAVIAFLYVKKDIFTLFKKVKISRRTANIIIAVIGIGIFVFVGAVTVLRYITYSNSTFDFGIFAQMYEYMKQKGTMDTTVERNYLLSHFGVHFSPIFYLGLPIYFIFSSPITVQLIQAFVMALPLIPITLLCRNYKMSNWMTIGVALIYALYPAMAGGAYYDIHENCFLTFMILMAVWVVERKKNILLAVFTLLTFFVKEDAPIYIMIAGAYFLFSKRDKKRGIILIAAAVIYFGLAVAIVNSYGLGILDSRFSNFYFNADGGLFQVIQTILTNPSYAMAQIIRNSGENQMDKIEYIFVMIIPIASALFTTGRKYSRYILLAPFIVINLMTTYPYLHSLTFQYNFGVIALFMYMIIMNLSDMKLKKAKTAVCVSVLCAGVMFVGMIFPKLAYYVDKKDSYSTVISQLDKALDTIPENASVCASGYFIPHLSKNLELYDQNHLEKDIYTDYLVVDKRMENEAAKFNNILASGQYESVYDVADVIQIYRKIQ